MTVTMVGQGSTRKRRKEARRKRFHQQASRRDAAPQAPQQPAQQQPASVMETRPGQVGTIPQAQVQPHQVVRRSGLPGTQPELHEGTYAPQSGQRIPVPAHLPHEEKIIQPRQPDVSAHQQADVTVILYSSGEAAVLLTAQLQALRRQTVQPRTVYVHADGASRHDEPTLAKLHPFRTPTRVGRQHRLAIAREVETSYVAILEEDTMPGARWLERAMQAMTDADSEEYPYGPAVIACSGVLQGSPNPADAHIVGPQLPRGEQSMEVDFGRQGWLFAADFVRKAQGLPYEGDSSDSLGILLAAAAQDAGIPTVVLDYGVDKENWGALGAATQGVDPYDAAEAFQAYLAMGWEPAYHGAGLAQPKQDPQSDAPTRASLPSGLQPGKVIERHGMGITTREFIPEQQTPAPSSKNEKILSPEEQTPPPQSASTETVMDQPSPPPESAKTEVIPEPSQPPQSDTGKK